MLEIIIIIIIAINLASCPFWDLAALFIIVLKWPGHDTGSW
jgi:hypothetical protein